MLKMKEIKLQNKDIRGEEGTKYFPFTHGDHIEK
jgi:hypothetical protein